MSLNVWGWHQPCNTHLASINNMMITVAYDFLFFQFVFLSSFQLDATLSTVDNGVCRAHSATQRSAGCSTQFLLHIQKGDCNTCLEDWSPVHLLFFSELSQVLFPTSPPTAARNCQNEMIVCFLLLEDLILHNLCIPVKRVVVFNTLLIGKS